MKPITLSPTQLDAALGLPPAEATGCLWCGASTSRASFAVGDRVFCSGKCARYFETAPVTSAATFFEDARRHFDQPRPLTRRDARKLCQRGIHTGGNLSCGQCRTIANPRPRLECTCAGRDYGLCPACLP